MAMPMHTKTVRANTGAQRARWFRRHKYQPQTIAITNKLSIAGVKRSAVLAELNTWGINRAIEGAVVLIVSVAVVPVGMEDVVKLHFAPLGNPEQVNATLPLNPPTAVTVTVELAEPPGVTVVGDSDEAEMRKSGAGGTALLNSQTS
jgi:hypothetical protein